MLADLLRIKSCVWGVQRSDELDGTADGRIWQSALAGPLWTADVTLTDYSFATMEQIAALIRRLDGAKESFYLYNPARRYPQADPDGSRLGTSTVTVKSIGSDGASLALEGLPANYTFTLGDKAHSDYGSGPTRRYFFEASETVEANSSGVTAEFAVFPDVPAGLSAGAVITLVNPAAKMFIVPGSFNPGTMSGLVTTGASFKALQRVR
jgi:hypothetical protein